MVRMGRGGRIAYGGMAILFVYAHDAIRQAGADMVPDETSDRAEDIRAISR